MQMLWQDLRYGIRMLVQKPSFTLIAVITLGLGIGASTAIFSVVNAVLLRPLPFPDSNRLVYVGQQYQSGLAGSGEPKFMFWREHAESFEALAAYSNFGGAGGNLAGGNEPEYVQGSRVSEDFFRVLGVYPALGRAFTKEEDTPGGDRVAILSDALWRRRFGGNPSLVGESVLLDNRPVTVVGIMPPEFKFLTGADLFVPMKARPTANYDPNAEVIGRLKPGVTLKQAQTEMLAIAEQYRDAFPKQMLKNESIGIESYQEFSAGNVSELLWFLLGAVVFLLLIACANVANLQLTRAAARHREIAVRMALGAGAKRIVQQLITEGLALALLGGGFGLMLSVWGTELLVKAMPRGLLPLTSVVGIDWRVLAFTLIASVTTGVLFGLAPAWQARKVDVSTALKEHASRGGTGRRPLRSALVITELALSLILLVGAGLLIRTFTNLMNVQTGFDPHNVLTSQVALNGERYDNSTKASAFYRDALERITSIPGVEAAAVTNKLPLDWQFNMPVVFSEQPDQVYSVQFRMISSDYFRVMQIPLRQGRLFTDEDRTGSAPVVIINEAFARRFFDQKDPFAQQLSVGRGLDEPLRQVMGIVGDVKQDGLDNPAPPMVYIPAAQISNKLLSVVRAFTAVNFVVRTTVRPLSLREAVKREIAAIDPTLPLSEARSMEEVMALSVAARRFNMLLVGILAGLGMILAIVGVYGVISYSVEQRTNEIGIRIALGARSIDVTRLILRQGALLAIVGVVTGGAGAVALTRLMKSLLFGVSAADPFTIIVTSVILTGVALGACFVPARRATRVDPMVALRYE